jgi:acyl carrier protein
MLPVAYVALETLPRTASGKVDRHSLPEPDALAAPVPGQVAPRTELERIIADVWREVLELPRVGIDSNFFDLGGHSLLVVRVHRRLQKLLGQELSVVELFNYPTIGSLAQHLSSDQEGGERPTRDRVRDRARKQIAALGRQRQAARRLGQ